MASGDGSANMQNIANHLQGGERKRLCIAIEMLLQPRSLLTEFLATHKHLMKLFTST